MASGNHTTIAFRPTDEQLAALKAWCEGHPRPDGERTTLSDALRAAIRALTMYERERQRERGYDRRTARPRRPKMG